MCNDHSGSLEKCFLGSCQEKCYLYDMVKWNYLVMIFVIMPPSLVSCIYIFELI